MKKRILKVTGRALVGLMVVFLIVFLPMLSLSKDNNLEIIFNAFVGARSNYQGVLEVWNIDVFESGTAPKSNYLNSIARNFERKNKGTYVLVKNISEFECLYLLEKGERPDIFSCSYSTAKKIQSYVSPLSSKSEISIDKNLLDAGTVDGKLFALAWCRGIYCLLSTTEKLSLAGKILGEGEKLSSVALSSGYEVTKKNSKKVISSLTFGANSVLLPQIAFSSYNDTRLETAPTIMLDENSFSQTQFSAYASFLSGKSTILLGTQRDVARLENRVELGKTSGVIYEPLQSKCDLVQFCLLSAGDDVIRREYAESFALELVKRESQEKIGQIGMIPVVAGINPYEKGIMKDIIYQNFASYEVFRIFE